MVKAWRWIGAVALGLVVAACSSTPTTVPVAAATDSGATAGGLAERMQHWQTANGAEVYFVPAQQLPMVDARVVFNAGSARDGGRPGAAKLLANALRTGADGMSADEIALRLESVGAQLSADAMRDMAWVSLRSLSSAAELAEASAVMRALLVEPDLPEGEIERLKNQMLVGLRSQLQDPGEVAERAFYRALYGDHPYGQVLDEGEIAALDRNALLDFYRRYFVAKNTVVAIVGDLDRAGAEALAEQLVGELPEGIKPAEIPPVPVLKEARSIHVPFPSQQAHVLIGQPGLRRGDADYYSLYLGNHVFGGSGFASRLMGEVREKRGLAYSVYSYFMPMAQNGPFQMGLQTRVDQAELAVQLVHDELQRFVAEGPSADELERAQLNVTGGSALRTDSNKKLVEYLSLIGFYDLPLDYLDAFNGHIEAESVASVRDAFQRRVNPDALITVVVGGDAE